ncbi:unnamed protein product [Clonostachys solani]|uniref:SET domain-containing protein n=1 Tax=Clonostachys solani TaxID=160281 RepID=A0A9P0EP20_9HYPO|nr:unnamed protein product [Clonostachys solani]
MDAIESLLRRAEGQGVKISGIKPIAVPGRGIGVVAIHDIKEGDAIMTVPIEAIRSLHTIPEDISCQLSPEMTIHGLLAAELALHRNPTADWAGLVPQWTDFEATVPMLWPEELQLLLPAEAKRILAKQLARFKIDWDTFRKGFPNQDRRDYLYAWLLVNTRAFYFDMNNMMSYPWHDRLALLPVADLFNHANTGCIVSLMTEHYIITADRPYRASEEMCISYRDHSNNYLISEYGFLLRDN